MAVKEILTLGNEALYERAAEVNSRHHELVERVVGNLKDTILDFKKNSGFGRGIAAPQIGEPYRIIYINIDGQETPMINPEISFRDSETFDLWDDCMSLPGLEIKVRRYKSCIVKYMDTKWNSVTRKCVGSFSELIQHEYDHLEGILAIERALHIRSIRFNSKKIYFKNFLK